MMSGCGGGGGVEYVNGESNAYHSLSESLRFRPLPLGAGFCVSLHTSVQNHLPFGFELRPTQPKWNHSIGHLNIRKLEFHYFILIILKN